MLLDRGEHDLVLEDIALLPAFRARGIGSALIRRLHTEAAAGGKPLQLRLSLRSRLQSYARAGLN